MNVDQLGAVFYGGVFVLFMIALVTDLYHFTMGSVIPPWVIGILVLLVLVFEVAAHRRGEQHA